MRIRKLIYYPRDVFMKYTGKMHPYEPPKGDIYIGSGNFLKQGKHQLQLLTTYAGLEPNNTVLDIGCGIGRTATALTEYLDSTGYYVGIDVVKKGIDWCNKTIHQDFPNFNFQYTPIHNDLYNQDETSATQFTFPFPAGHFDLIFLFSVFTHMLPNEIEHYLLEIHRLLKPEGRCLSTFFLLPENELQFFQHKNAFKFPYSQPGYLLMDEKVQSANVALFNDTLQKMVYQAGLRISFRRDGHWKDYISTKEGLDFQDVVVLKKVGKM